MPSSPMPPQPASTEPADLQQIPLEELERMIMDRAGALEQVMAQSARGDVMPAEPEMEMAGSEMAGSEMAPEGAMPDGGEINPGAVKAASAMLVEAGLLEEITDTLTPEVLNVLTMLAEQEAPGLYDIQNVAHLMELINGIRTGLIPLSIEPRQQAAPELGPVPIPGGGGLPGSAGLPGGGLQPLPGEYPSGLPRGGAY